MSSLLISNQCLESRTKLQWYQFLCIWTFLKTLALNTIYRCIVTSNHDFQGPCQSKAQTHTQCFIMHVGVEGESTAAATTKSQLVRPHPPPITRGELVTDRCERPINHRNNESGTWASGSHGTEIIASALIALIELLKLLANYQAIPITNTSLKWIMML